jgi:hypothetical protein
VGFRAPCDINSNRSKFQPHHQIRANRQHRQNFFVNHNLKCGGDVFAPPGSFRAKPRSRTARERTRGGRGGQKRQRDNDRPGQLLVVWTHSASRLASPPASAISSASSHQRPVQQQTKGLNHRVKSSSQQPGLSLRTPAKGKRGDRSAVNCLASRRKWPVGQGQAISARHARRTFLLNS